MVRRCWMFRSYQRRWDAVKLSKKYVLMRSVMLVNTSIGDDAGQSAVEQPVCREFFLTIAIQIAAINVGRLAGWSSRHALQGEMRNADNELAVCFSRQPLAGFQHANVARKESMVGTASACPGLQPEQRRRFAVSPTSAAHGVPTSLETATAVELTARNSASNSCVVRRNEWAKF